MKYLAPLACLSLLSGPILADDYQDWLNKTRSDFQSYLDENDKAFVQFLQNKWTPVDVRPAQQRDPEPKPVEPPQAPIDQTVENDVPAADSELTDNTPAETTPGLTLPPAEPSQPVEEPLVTLPQIPQPQPDSTPAQSRKPAFTFYGSPLYADTPTAFHKTYRGKLNSKNIAAYWTTLASSDHKGTVASLLASADELQLNSWGTALLFDRYARSLHRDDNSRVLLSWFLLVKAGFDARVAYNDKVHLLMTADQALFGVTYFRLDGHTYYAVNLNDKPLAPGKVFTYEGQHDSGRQALDFSEPVRFVPAGDNEEKTFSFHYADQQYSIRLSYPQRYVSYFASYPQLSLPNYFKAGLPAVTAQSLLDQLKPVVAGQSEKEAVNRLLRFVQTAFSYRTDDEQFHEENYLFPLETLHYPYSDCEDRAALFAWLTESLLGLDVVILDYPGHVATAVAFNGDVKGDQWPLNNRRYVVADPTYVNASVGMTMPAYAGVRPTIHTF